MQRTVIDRQQYELLYAYLKEHQVHVDGYKAQPEELTFEGGP